jgi:hypothetical protein
MSEYILDLMWVDVLAGRWPLPNVWLGVSVCDREEADARCHASSRRRRHTSLAQL